MRMFRLVGAAVAVALAMTLVGFVPTQAAPARPPHKFIGVKAQEVGDSGRFFAGGRITTYRNKPNVLLQKAACKRGCPYKKFKKGSTNARGGFRINFDGPVGSCYRLVVPPTPRNRTTRKVVGCIIRGA